MIGGHQGARGGWMLDVWFIHGSEVTETSSLAGLWGVRPRWLLRRLKVAQGFAVFGLGFGGGLFICWLRCWLGCCWWSNDGFGFGPVQVVVVTRSVWWLRGKGQWRRLW